LNFLGLFVSFGLLIIAMSVHEFSHGWVAYKLGDPTAKYSGRLTLNPLAHIDPIGTVLLPLFLFIATNGRFVFGAAKPVPISYWNLKNPKRDIIWIGLAGPLSNFIFAFLLGLMAKIISPFALLSFILRQLAFINIVLGVFNLIPIPPLDGSRIVTGVLPDRLARNYISIEPFGFIIIIGLIATGFFNFLVWPIVRLISSFLGVY
jgi:Zn-dependent protease